jgi:hypothetical protein
MEEALYDRPSKESKQPAPVAPRKGKKSIDRILSGRSGWFVVNACIDVPVEEGRLEDRPQYR